MTWMNENIHRQVEDKNMTVRLASGQSLISGIRRRNEGESDDI